MSEQRRRWARSWVGLLGVLIAGGALVVALAGCSGEGAEVARVERNAGEEDVESVTAVIDELSPGSPTGFDPAVWSAADPSLVLPEGSSVAVVDETVIVEADSASVDAVVSGPDGVETRSWVFLHRVDGEWLIYGTLPLDTGP